MPDKPKRRKNNKNKRKNKTNRTDTCKNNDGLNNLDNGDGSKNVNTNASSILGQGDTNIVTVETPAVDNIQIAGISHDSEITSGIENKNNLIGDFNNNSNNNIINASTSEIINHVFDIHTLDQPAYVVEVPDQSNDTNKSKLKNVKSKSLDNDDVTNIIDITEDVEIENQNNLPVVDSQNILITHVDSDVEWEEASDLSNLPRSLETATGTLSVTTIPLAVVKCDHNKSLTPDEEKSLRSYLKTIDLVTKPENVKEIEIKTEIEEIINQEIKQRLRKKASADDFFIHRIGPQRILDVIDEEGSSESSMTSRRQSYLSDKKSDIEDLEDDVFEDKNKTIKEKLVTGNNSSRRKYIGKLVPQECVLVGAKMKDPEVEARGEWTMKTVEKMTGAEVVYLTDTSSSSSSLHEIGNDDDDDDVDTDVSVRMITPTIEVTDTENFLKKSFIRTSHDNNENKFQENSTININNSAKDTSLKTEKIEHIIKIELPDDLKTHKNIEIDEIKSDMSCDNENDHRADINTSKTSHKENQDSNIRRQPKEHVISVQLDKHMVKNEHDFKDEPMQNSHEIVILSTDNIETNLYVKDIDETKLAATTSEVRDKLSAEDTKTENKSKADNYQEIFKECYNKLNTEKLPVDTNSPEEKNRDKIGQHQQNTSTSYSSETSSISSKINHIETKDNKYVLEAKIIKCEFNDAINNLINEVSIDHEGVHENPIDSITREDSSSSIGSSQCTAKYNPNCESLSDISNTEHHENTLSNTKSHVQASIAATSHIKDVFDTISKSTTESKELVNSSKPDQPLGLKDLCVSRIAALPYGDKILEELASVAKRLQEFTDPGNTSHKISNHQNQIRSKQQPSLNTHVTSNKISSSNIVKDVLPPPIQPRHSSLKKSHDDEHQIGMCNKLQKQGICLSPSQKMLMDKVYTTTTKESSSHMVNMHKQIISEKQREYCKKTIIENDTNSSPNVPFKSQTGSRLLALIRDPSLTRNINSLNDRLNNSQSICDPVLSENCKKPSNTNLNFTFKPIPPPRPKKYSSSIYESDESSDFTDHSMHSLKKERKLFHYSTGTLNKEIENDVSSIQNMHRFLTDKRDILSDNQGPRRPSLPKDLCEQQMEYIRKKEKEVEAEIQRLEAVKDNINSIKKSLPKAPFISQKEIIDEKIKDSNNYSITRKKDVEVNTQNRTTKRDKMSSLFSSSQEELLREKMYTEYVTQMAEREERRQHKVIKITNPLISTNKFSKSTSALDILDAKSNNRIEREFISKARERWNKLGIKDPETEDESEYNKYIYKEPKVIEHKIKVIEAGHEKDVEKLPSHLQEFVQFAAKDKEHRAGSSETVMIAPTFKARSTSPAIWRPGAPPPVCGSARSPGAPPPPPPPPPVWSPGSAGASPQTPRKTFRPVHFEESPPSYRKFGNSEQNGCTSGSESEGRLRTSHSAPVTGLSTLGAPNVSSRLPRVLNPTVTLLQKAREGQLSRATHHLQQEKDAARLPRDRPSPPRGDPVHALRKEYASESEAERSDYERSVSRKMADAHRKVEGIGPITKDGMPVALRSEVKDPSRWYKKMYDTIHKNKYDDDYVTIRYKSRRGQPPERVSSNKSQYAYFDPRSGYLSEPEGGLSRLGSSTWSDAYDSDTTGPRRRTASVQEERRLSEASSPYMPSNNKYSTLASARASQEIYKNQPGRIEDYVPGRSSVIDKESKQQNISSTTSLPQASPKDKKDLTATILSKSNMARALKESGYESDSTLVFRRRDDSDGPLSPAERRAAYRDLQAGGEPPLRGFRSPAPPRQESPRRYVESDVNIHYRCPVRHDPLPLVPERELARQQAEHMKRLYREQKRNKYLQELQDMQNRRHQDNFTPSQKNILPLNRYDEADKIMAKALYTFNGQTTRELSFRKGEIIHVRRQIDNNWYEGELHGRIGLFPYNYVEIQKGDMVQTPKKPAVVEGRARAKFDFTAQTNLELPLKKGEVVVLTRRIDQNWWEGRNGTKTGIFPDSYVTILQEPSHSKPEPQPSLNSEKPIASPAAHGLLNGTAKRSMGAHSYTPQQNSQALSNAPPATQPLPGYVAKGPQGAPSAAERGYGAPGGAGVDLNNTEPLYVDTNAEAVPYRAMYKYRPQNPDELELNEGDTVYVLEKCDDGWYVGSSQRTGRFGTFPGNYVERI